MTYEYLCSACGHHWEAEQSISAAPLKSCPSCTEDTAKRQVSGGAGFILKGGGWYADLYSSAKPNSKPEEKAAPVAGADAKSSESSSSPTPAGGSSQGAASGATSTATAPTTTPAATPKQGGASAS